jgi:hypothetical protein
MQLLGSLKPLVRRLINLPRLWLGVGALALAAVILHQIPHRMEVTLHLLTERVAFIIAGANTSVSLLEGQPLTSLTLRGVTRLPLPVQEVRYGGRAHTPIDGRMVLQSRSQDAGLSSITFADEGLRLIRLTLASGTPVAF